jgi:hypothetical protein
VVLLYLVSSRVPTSLFSHHSKLISLIIGNTITEDDVKEMLASADVDGDGMINYEEFLKVMVSYCCRIELLIWIYTNCVYDTDTF